MDERAPLRGGAAAQVGAREAAQLPAAGGAGGRGLHPSTSHLNLSPFSNSKHPLNA